MDKKNAIFFSCDKNFFFAFIVALLSLKKHNAALLEHTDVLVYYQGLSEEDKAFANRILPCQFTEYKFAVDTNFEHSNFKIFTQLTFARYEIFDLLDKYAKILYIDVDVLIDGDLSYIFDNFGSKGGVAMCKDQQKGHMLITKNFIKPLPQYDMTVPCYNAGICLYTDQIPHRKELRMWCYERTAEWLENLTCPDQGVLNVMFQEFHIPVEVMPDTCNCLPSNPKYLDKDRQDVLIHHCAGRGTRLWGYTYYGPWQEYYQEYLAMGGTPHTQPEHKWLQFIKKHNLQRFDFFERSPDPQMHPARFLKYMVMWPYKYIRRKHRQEA